MSDDEAQNPEDVMRELRLVPLPPDQIVQAYPLIQTVRPGLGLEAWQAYARNILDAGPESGTGIATLQDPRGLIAGLFVHRIVEDADHGRTLVAEDFVALDIIQPEAVAASLAEALETVARQQNCHAIHTSVACTDNGRTQHILDLMRALGHRLEHFQLCKALPATS